MIKRRVILFDLDYTLLDTSQLRKLTDQAIVKAIGISKKKLAALNQEFSLTLKSSIDFSPRNYINFLVKSQSEARLRKPLINIFFTQAQIYQASLCSETIVVLKDLRKDFRLGIYSEGNLEFQTTKLDLSGIKAFLSKELIFIYKNKKGQAGRLVRCWGDLVIVDNNPDHIQDLSLARGVSPIWLRRGPKKKFGFRFSGASIKNLSQLRAVLNVLE